MQQGFTIEMDQAYVLEQCIQAVIEDAGQDLQLRNWLVEFATKRLLNGQNWDFKKELTALGNEIFAENFSAQGTLTLPHIDHLGTLSHKLWQLIQHFEQLLQGFGKKALAAMTQAGLTVQDFAYGKSGVAGYFEKLKTKKSFSPTARTRKALHDATAWYSKTSPKKQAIENLVNNTLQNILQTTVQYYQTHAPAYYTALAVKRFMYALGIMNHLLAKLNDYREAQGVILMADTTVFLRKIIDENETPFLYEKIGTFYQNFLIDELQDISKFQWENFKPLIINGLAEAHMSLMVGDVKQAIYRWRGGDRQLLLTQIAKDIGREKIEFIDLNNNWRSKQLIIDFNNTFFSQAAAYLTAYFENEAKAVTDPALKKYLATQIQQVHTTYHTAYQHRPGNTPKADQGYVNFTFLDTDHTIADHPIHWREQVKQRLPLLIEKLLHDGFACNDIALLVRNNQEAHELMQTLLTYQHTPQSKPRLQYDVVASEALRLGQSVWVNILVNALQYLADEENHLNKATLTYLYQVHVLKNEATDLHVYFDNTAQHDPSCQRAPCLPIDFLAKKNYLKQLPVYELVESLIGMFGLHHAEAVSFVQAFQDLVGAFSQQPYADIGHFITWWQERGHKYTMAGMDEQVAVKIMTIHQAKGLQFKVVILPFCTWSLDHTPTQTQVMWCNTAIPPFSTWPCMPVVYHNSLTETAYAQDYYEEKRNAYLDNFNLLYVALTRAEDRLYAFSETPAKKKFKTTADVLYQVFSTTQPAGPIDEKKSYLSWQHYWNATENILAIGKEMPLPKPPATTHNVASLQLNQYVTHNGRSKLRVKSSTMPLFNESGLSAKKIHYGNVIHQILAQTQHPCELEGALSKLLLEKMIVLSDIVVLKQKINALWHHPLVKNWFNGTWKVKNEATMLLPSGKTVRPDRVMYQGHEVLVVDFKTGVKYPQHKTQVKQYAALLQEMGYANVHAYLLYTENIEVLAC